jgi:molecular chaperone HscC
LLLACLRDWNLALEDLEGQALASLRDAIEQLKREAGEGSRTLSWSGDGQAREWVLDELSWPSGHLCWRGCAPPSSRPCAMPG